MVERRQAESSPAEDSQESDHRRHRSLMHFANVTYPPLEEGRLRARTDVPFEQMELPTGQFKITIRTLQARRGISSLSESQSILVSNQVQAPEQQSYSLGPRNSSTANNPDPASTAVLMAQPPPQRVSVQSPYKLSHEALAKALTRERENHGKYFCRHCENQASCFTNLVLHFRSYDKGVAAERLENARATYEFYTG